jgi:hypothetical protein
MAHCIGRNYIPSTSGIWYKFIYTPAKDDTRCSYCYKKILELKRGGPYGMEQYVSKTEGKINCDTYRRSLSKICYNDIFLSIASADGNIPYISYNKETSDMEKFGIYCVEMPYNTQYKITINIKDYLYKYIVKRNDEIIIPIDETIYNTNEKTFGLGTEPFISDSSTMSIIIFKYTRELQLTSAAAFVVKTIPSKPLLTTNYMYQCQELLLSGKVAKLNDYLANANLLDDSTTIPTITPTVTSTIVQNTQITEQLKKEIQLGIHDAFLQFIPRIDYTNHQTSNVNLNNVNLNNVTLSNIDLITHPDDYVTL